MAPNDPTEKPVSEMSYAEAREVAEKKAAFEKDNAERAAVAPTTLATDNTKPAGGAKELTLGSPAPLTTATTEKTGFLSGLFKDKSWGDVLGNVLSGAASGAGGGWMGMAAGALTGLFAGGNKKTNTVKGEGAGADIVNSFLGGWGDKVIPLLLSLVISGITGKGLFGGIKNLFGGGKNNSNPTENAAALAKGSDMSTWTFDQRLQFEMFKHQKQMDVAQLKAQSRPANFNLPMAQMGPRPGFAPLRPPGRMPMPRPGFNMGPRPVNPQFAAMHRPGPFGRMG